MQSSANGRRDASRMYDELTGWQVYGKVTLDGVTYLDVGDPAERDKDMPAPGSSGFYAQCDNGKLRNIVVGSEEFFRVLDAFASQC